MYSVDERDEVTALPDVLQSSIGAPLPLPLVLVTEHRVLLAYLVAVAAQGWDGSTTRVVHYTTAGESAVVDDGPTSSSPPSPCAVPSWRSTTSRGCVRHS